MLYAETQNIKGIMILYTKYDAVQHMQDSTNNTVKNSIHLAIQRNVGIFTKCIVHAESKNYSRKNNQWNQDEKICLFAHKKRQTDDYKTVTG